MTLWRDFRYAVRTLIGSPVFTSVTIITLALGIGVNTAIFSVVQAVLLKPLPYPRPEQLVYISTQFPRLGFNQFWVSSPEYLELQERARSFSAIGAFSLSQINLTTPERPRRVNHARVSAEMFSVLGTPPLLGRWFEMAETRPNGPDVAILSYDLWRSAFGGDRTIVGRLVDVGGVRRTVVGVMPAGFDVADGHVAIFLPLIIDPANRQTNRGSHFLYLVGRLQDQATLAAAKAELETLLGGWPSSIARAASATQGPHTPNREGHRVRYDPLGDQIVGSARTAILVLQGAVVLVLLIACANVANLLLARADSRYKEFAVRAALGAGARQLLMPFLAEGLLMSLVGAGLGVALAVFGIRTLIAAFPDSLPRSAAIGLDGRVLGFTLAVAIICAFVFSLTPLMHLRAGIGAAALKDGGPRATAGSGRNRFRRALVAGEVALAVALVIGAGLLLRTVLNLSRVDSGFNRDRLVTFGISLPAASYAQPDQVLAFHRRLLETLARTPGVQRVAEMTGLPPSRQVNANDTDIEGYEPQPGGPAENVDYYQTVTPGYIEAMAIPVVEGRAFLPTDGGDTTVLINETMARTFFRETSPIGRRLRCCGPNDRVPWFTIIGVVKDVKQGGLDQRTGTELYFNLEQLPKALPNSMPQLVNIVMRTALPPSALAASIQRTVEALDPALPIIRLRSMDDVFADAMGRPRLLANLLGVFAAVALLLAGVGSYGVLSYMVNERRREIGIRMALGATRAVVMRVVMSQGFQMTLIGIVLGLIGALALNRVLRTLLFGVGPYDVPTLAGVVVLIALVSLIGCYLPARSATRVDPLIALRDE